MRTIPAGEFKAKCLALMDEVHAGGETILITKRGKPVARLSPPKGPSSATESPDSIFGFMRGTSVTVGNIVGPILPAEEWNHLEEDTDSLLKI